MARASYEGSARAMAHTLTNWPGFAPPPWPTFAPPLTGRMDEEFPMKKSRFTEAQIMGVLR
ncbi:MAG TPA: hypothetical protein VLA38_02595, partial [Steroidobacteraceae bacterium]|nr:hypothetical protein [Steroidobacteraceae bacterium]